MKTMVTESVHQCVTETICFFRDEKKIINKLSNGKFVSIFIIECCVLQKQHSYNGWNRRSLPVKYKWTDNESRTVTHVQMSSTYKGNYARALEWCMRFIWNHFQWYNPNANVVGCVKFPHSGAEWYLYHWCFIWFFRLGFFQELKIDDNNKVNAPSSSRFVWACFDMFLLNRIRLKAFGNIRNIFGKKSFDQLVYMNMIHSVQLWSTPVNKIPSLDFARIVQFPYMKKWALTNIFHEMEIRANFFQNKYPLSSCRSEQEMMNVHKHDFISGSLYDNGIFRMCTKIYDLFRFQLF